MLRQATAMSRSRRFDAPFAVVVEMHRRGHISRESNRIVVRLVSARTKYECDGSEQGRMLLCIAGTV